MYDVFRCESCGTIRMFKVGELSVEDTPNCLICTVNVGVPLSLHRGIHIGRIDFGKEFNK